MRKTYWQVLWSNQRAPCAASRRTEGWRRFDSVRRNPLSPRIGLICSAVEFCSSISSRTSPRTHEPADRPQRSTCGHDAPLRGSLLLPPATDFFSSGLVFPSRDDVFVCREALLHDRVSGRQGEPSDGRGPDPSHGSKLLQPDDRCLNEQLPGATGQVPVPDPGPGVPRDGRPPLPHRGSPPARRLPPTASALLRDATPRPAQLLPLGAPEQVLWTQISR